MYIKITMKNVRTNESIVLTDLSEYLLETVVGLGPVAFVDNRIIVRAKAGSVDSGGQLEDRNIGFITKLRGSTPFKLDGKVADFKAFMIPGDLVEIVVENSIREYTINGRVNKHELREGQGERSFIIEQYETIIYCADPRFFNSIFINLDVIEFSDGDSYAEIEDITGNLLEGNSYSEIEDITGNLLEGNSYSLLTDLETNVLVFNNGELPTPLAITLGGVSERPGLRIVKQDETIQEIRISTTLTATQTVIIDTDKATVRLLDSLDESDIEAFGILEGEPDLREFFLNPKENTLLVALSESGDKNVKVTYREAYIGVE